MVSGVWRMLYGVWCIISVCELLTWYLYMCPPGGGPGSMQPTGRSGEHAQPHPLLLLPLPAPLPLLHVGSSVEQQVLESLGASSQPLLAVVLGHSLTAVDRVHRDLHLAHTTHSDTLYTALYTIIHIKYIYTCMYTFYTYTCTIHIRYTCTVYTCTCTCVMRDEKEGRKKQARSNKQTRQSNTAHPRHSLFLRKMSCLGYAYLQLHINTTCIHVREMKDEQARSNKQQGKVTQHIYVYTCIYTHTVSIYYSTAHNIGSQQTH